MQTELIGHYLAFSLCVSVIPKFEIQVSTCLFILLVSPTISYMCPLGCLSSYNIYINISISLYTYIILYMWSLHCPLVCPSSWSPKSCHTRVHLSVHPPGIPHHVIHVSTCLSILLVSPPFFIYVSTVHLSVHPPGLAHHVIHV